MYFVLGGLNSVEHGVEQVLWSIGSLFLFTVDFFLVVFDMKLNLLYYIVSYEIKYAAVAGLSCVRSKSQQLWLLRSALDQGETCLDELLAAWFFQVQHILLKT